MASGPPSRPPLTARLSGSSCSGPSHTRRTIRLGPTSPTMAGTASTTRCRVSGAATARVPAVSASTPTLCRGTSTLRIPPQAAPVPPVWRRVDVGVPRREVPFRNAPTPALSARSRGTISGYPISQGHGHRTAFVSTPAQEVPTGPNPGWQSLLQAARERATVAPGQGSGRGVAPGASTLMSASALRALEAMVQEVDDFGSEDGACSICLGADKTQVVELRCGNRHRFHKSCINTWMVASIAMRDGMPRCPLCRKGLNMGQGSRRDVLDLSLQELVAVERLLEDVRVAVLEQRSMIEQRTEGEAAERRQELAGAPWSHLRAAQIRALMLEDRVAELRSAVYELQSRLSLL